MSFAHIINDYEENKVSVNELYIRSNEQLRLAIAAAKKGNIEEQAYFMNELQATVRAIAEINRMEA